MIDVRIGIVSWNTADLLDRCLGALPEAMDDFAAEVVVVDNASTDHSLAVARNHPGVRVIMNAENRGYARAMNQALADSGAPVLIALNPDTEPPPGSLASLVGLLRADPSLGLVAPRLVNIDGSAQHSVYRFPSPLVSAVVGFSPPSIRRGWVGQRFWLEGGSDHRCSTDVDWVIGAVHVIRASAVGDGPIYDERWFMYVEDLELCWRLARSGWRRRLVAEVTVPHVGNAAGVQAWGNDRTRRWLENTYDWYQRDRGSAAVRAWAVVNILGVIVHLGAVCLVGAIRRRPGDRRKVRPLAAVLPIHLRWALMASPRASDRLSGRLAGVKGRR